MISTKIFVAAVLGALGLGMVPSCASTSRTEGTDSNTHWLEQCRTDKDCGSLQCRCGGCTKACSAPSDCTSLGATAACVTSACSVEPKTCVATCTTSADCPHGGNGFECRGGQCAAVVAIDGGQDSGVCPNSVQPDGPCSGSGSCNGGCAGGFQSSYTCSDGHWARDSFLLIACDPDAGHVPVDGGLCPASAASGAPCDSRIGTCFTQCKNGMNGRFSCSGGQWVAGHGLFPCGTCVDGIKGGDACSSADSQCFTPCVNGLHGQYVCSNGAWVAGKGLFTCDTEAGSASGGPRDAGKDPCAPMDAHTGNLPCIGTVGYAWTGTDCAEIECSCDGADCGAMYQTRAACRSDRAECLAKLPVSTACARGSDCVVAGRACCPSCGASLLSDTTAVNVNSALAFRNSLECMTGSCSCAEPKGSVAAVCQAGTCTAVDMAIYAPCIQDGDCQVRAKDCCECGSDLSDPNALVALNPSINRASYDQLACSQSAPCNGCVPRYPSGVRAKCDLSLGSCVLSF